MKYLFLACAMFALLASGCGEEVADKGGAKGHVTAEVTEVNKEALQSALDANELTLVDFTATW